MKRITRLEPMPSPPPEERYVLVSDRKLDELTEKVDRLATNLRPMHQAPAPMPTDYLTREEVAAMTKYSTKTVRRWIRSGRLRGHGPSGNRFRRADVEALMREFPADGDGEEKEIAEARARLHAEE